MVIFLIDHYIFTVYMLVLFHSLVVVFWLFQIYFSKQRVSNGLDSDQARRSVGPDLGPNSLRRLYSSLTRKELIDHSIFKVFFCFAFARPDRIFGVYYYIQ